jgi:archaellum biogenesis ATPase FlaH
VWEITHNEGYIMGANEFTGLKELDQMLDSGIERGDVVLFFDDIGSGNDFILSEIIRNHHNKGGSVILVMTSPDSLRFANLIDDIIHSKNFTIIDCISPKNVYKTEYYIENCSKVFDIFLTIKTARDKQLKNNSEDAPGPLVCLYSLSSLFINFETNEVIQFFNKNIKEAIRCRTIEYYLLSQGITENSVEKRVQALANTVIKTRTEFREHRRQNYIQIVKHASGIPYSEEKQYTIAKNDNSRPEIVFSTPFLDRMVKSIQTSSSQATPKGNKKAKEKA